MVIGARVRNVLTSELRRRLEMFVDKLKKASKSPIKVLVFSFDLLKLRSTLILYKVKHRFFRKRVIIGKAVNFNQKTIFTGLGHCIINDNVTFGYKLGGHFHKNLTEIQARYIDSKVVIKENVNFNNSTFITAGNYIEIGRNCNIGARVTMMDFEAHGTNPSERGQLGKFGEIHIGNNVWIGNDVTILKNVFIGDNSIVAAGSVVTKGSYPSNCIVGGNPAKIVKELIIE